MIEELVKLLLNNNKYISENGKILKTRLYEDAMNMNEDLLRILLKNKKLKKSFFKQIEDIIIFDKQKFIWFIESKEFLPNSYTKYLNKIGLGYKGDYIQDLNDVELDFPYKDCVLFGGQSKDEQKTTEIFYNEIISQEQISRMFQPKVFSSVKKFYGIIENQKNKVIEERKCIFTEKDNLIVKGNNLIALTSILKKYEGKIKCICIDPPYNTGKDSFKYNDTFKHSTWLTFMKNRLEISKKLLKEDGVIFVQCDDNEQAYLKVLMDNIFGREQFIRTITWLKGNAQNDAKNIQNNTEYILVYSKNNSKSLISLEKRIEEIEIFKDKKNEKYYYKGAGITTGGEGGTLNSRPNLGTTIYYNPKSDEIIVENDYDIEKAKKSNIEADVYYNNIELTKKGFVIIRPPKKNKKLGCWTWNKDKIESEKNRLLITEKYSVVKKEYIDNIDESKIKFKNNKLYYNIYKEGPYKSFINISSSSGTKEIKKLFNEKKFENPKNEILINHLLSMCTKEKDIVLDFFLGSGTTAAVAHKMGRRYIGIEQMDYIETIPVERLKKVIEGEQGGISKSVSWNGGGSFVYCELMENANELISLISSATEETIVSIKNKIYNDERIIPYITKQELLNIDSIEFENLSLDEKKKALCSIVDKNKLYINYSDIDNEDYIICEEDKAFTRSFYEGD